MSKIDEIIDLLPCPFCGNTVIHRGYNALKKMQGLGMFYRECCKCLVSLDGYATSIEADIAWNTRTESPELARLREENKTLVEVVADFASEKDAMLLDSVRTREALAAAEECVGHYADELNWMMGGSRLAIPRMNNLYLPVDGKMRINRPHGYDHAVKAQAEIKRLKGE